MVVGILQIELSISDAMSLKDKRRVVNSVKDRLHREHQIAVAEVDRLDAHQVAVLGMAAVSNSVSHVQSLLDWIVEQMKTSGRYVVNAHAVEIITGR